MNSACFLDAPILVEGVPPRWALGPEVGGEGGGGSLLLLLLLLFLPPLNVGREGEGVQVGALHLPEALRG